MIYLKLSAVLFANCFLLIAVALSLTEVNNFVLVYIAIQTISIVLNVYVGIGYFVRPPNTQMQIDKNSMCSFEHLKMYRDGDKSCYLCGMSFSD